MVSFYIKNSRNISVIIAVIIISSLLLCAALGFPHINSKKTEKEPENIINPNDNFDGPTLVIGNASPSPTEKFSGPDLQNREAVGDDFFSDAAFIGNSLIDGFRVFSGLTTCDYYAATSMTVIGADSKNCIKLENGNMGTIIDGIRQKPYGKIYILLGINEIGYDVGAFIQLYGEMLDTIIEIQPDCDIYIMGLSPVSSAKSNSSETFNMTRIKEYNSALYQLAADKECYYVDLVEALAGADGYLPAEETTDGIHFTADLYKTWLDYIKTHYA